MTKYLLLLFSAVCFSQQIKAVDFKSVLGRIVINAGEKSICGEITYQFDVVKPIDTLKIDAQKMTFSDVKLNGKSVPFLTTNKDLQIIFPFKKSKNKLNFQYTAKPKQTLYFIGKDENIQIWTQGQGKYTSHWFPSFDDVNEKVIFNLDIIFDKNYQVVSNGNLQSNKTTKENTTWVYKMKNPMSSYLLMLAIGKFDKKTVISKSGIPLEMYYQPQDIAKFEPTYRHSKAIFDFLESEIGVKYPWKIYKQVPVRDFLYAGMENTSATTFSQDFVVDSIGVNDKSYFNVNAHELAHQWFGDLVTAKSGKDHWLQEGFATYYELLSQQHVFGNDFFNWKLYEIAERLQQNAQIDTIPILNEKASSLTFYQKGAWALHVLRTSIGHDNFQKAIKNYLEKYKFQNVTTDNFLAAVEKVSDFDTKNFRKRWLESGTFEIQDVLTILKQNKMIQQYFEIAEMENIPFAEKKVKFESVLKSDVFYAIKEEIIYQLQEVSFQEKVLLIRLAMQTNNLNIRQAIAQNFKEIPLEFKSEYETLLDDDSYITREIALNTLWSNFPKEQSILLEKTKSWIGFNDNNLRILWLTLALRTTDFQLRNKLAYYQELLQYASSDFETSTRQNALNNLIYLDKNDENYLPYFANGLTSHKWQMVKFCKEKIRLFLKNKNHKMYFESLISKIPIDEKNQLEKLLKE